MQEARDAVMQQKYSIEDELEKIQKECVLQNEILEACKKKKADFTFAGEQLAFIKEINREFEQLGIDERAKMACEYVIGIKDEDWRNAIEAFLGIHRYAVIVSPAAFDIANRMLDKSGHRYHRIGQHETAYAKRNLPVKKMRYFIFWIFKIPMPRHILNSGSGEFTLSLWKRYQAMIMPCPKKES